MWVEASLLSTLNALPKELSKKLVLPLNYFALLMLSNHHTHTINYVTAAKRKTTAYRAICMELFGKAVIILITPHLLKLVTFFTVTQ